MSQTINMLHIIYVVLNVSMINYIGHIKLSIQLTTNMYYFNKILEKKSKDVSKLCFFLLKIFFDTIFFLM